MRLHKTVHVHISPPFDYQRAGRITILLVYVSREKIFFLYSTPFLRGFLLIILRIRDRTATACLSTYDFFFLLLLLFWVEERKKKRTLYDVAWRCPTRRSIRSSFMYTFTPRPALLHPHLADDRCIINNSLSVYSSWLCGGGGDGRPLKQGKNMPFINFLALVIVPLERNTSQLIGGEISDWWMIIS